MFVYGLSQASRRIIGSPYFFSHLFPSFKIQFAFSYLFLLSVLRNIADPGVEPSNSKVSIQKVLVKEH